MNPSKSSVQQPTQPVFPTLGLAVLLALVVACAANDPVMARDYSLGYCSVSTTAPPPCEGVRGKRASGVAPGCQHDDCTAAKSNARANLLQGIPAQCGAYIDCGGPCRCIQKAEADALQTQEASRLAGERDKPRELTPMAGKANVRDLELGGGAQFWAYISPQNETSEAVTQWKVTIEQTDGDWSGSITSEDPERQLKTPGLSGVFKVRVTASGPKLPETTLEPLPDSRPDITCSANCAAMVGIVATEAGTGAHYWTVSDALCRRE
jgi:hypothetical protein